MNGPVWAYLTNVPALIATIVVLVVIGTWWGTRKDEV